MKLLIEVIGWAGALMILLAYGLLSTGRMSARTIPYHMLNIVGALCFVVNSGYNGALPSAALNVIWLGIGTFAVARLRSQRAVQ